MNALSHLPNAAHIDRVLASVKAHPELWDQAWDQAWEQAWYRAFDQAWDARDQARQQARGQVWDQVSFRVRGALLALITYDDCAKYLNLPIDQLQMLYHLTEHPACLLLQPAVVAFAKERELVQD
jgi:hypothetical protein